MFCVRPKKKEIEVLNRTITELQELREELSSLRDQLAGWKMSEEAASLDDESEECALIRQELDLVCASLWEEEKKGVENISEDLDIFSKEHPYGSNVIILPPVRGDQGKRGLQKEEKDDEEFERYMMHYLSQSKFLEEDDESILEDAIEKKDEKEWAVVDFKFGKKYWWQWWKKKSSLV